MPIKDSVAAISRIRKNNIVINKDYVKFLEETQLDSFESIWRHKPDETVKNIKPRSITRFTVKHGDTPKSLYLKRHNLEFAVPARLLRPFLRRKSISQGILEFENICDFRKSRLPTVTPVAAGEKFNGFFRASSFLVTEDFYPYISLEYLLDHSPHFFEGRQGESRKKILINEISALAKRMHQNGFNHRDFNATHILLYYENESGPPELALFDLQRVENHGFIRLRWKIKSLARLNYSLPDEIFNPQDRMNILLFYNGKTSPGIIDRLQWFWIEKKTARIRRHTEKSRGRKKGME
ncbi:MAG: hypothetical protein K9J85_11685 [Desulfobacteraceae bacterium]|nr:hypothetical protein [Desulfobacteraceae bacterium]